MNSVSQGSCPFSTGPMHSYCCWRLSKTHRPNNSRVCFIETCCLCKNIYIKWWCNVNISCNCFGPALGHSQTDPNLSHRCRKAPWCSSFTCTYLPYGIVWTFSQYLHSKDLEMWVCVCLKMDSTVYNLVFGFGTLVFDPVWIVFHLCMKCHFGANKGATTLTLARFFLTKVIFVFLYLNICYLNDMLVYCLKIHQHKYFLLRGYTEWDQARREWLHWSHPISAVDVF